MSTIRLTALDATTIDLKTPLWKYETKIKMPLSYSQRADGTTGIFDAGTAYDLRTCKCTFLNDVTDHGALVDFLRNSLQGRGRDVGLSFPSGNGFFPFGPDLGDAGTFTIRVLDFEPSEQLMKPFKWWKDVLVLQLISGPTPSYSLPSVTEYGNLQVGNVTNFRYPQTTFKTKYNYAVNNTTLFSGVDQIDLGENADSWAVTFGLTSTESACAVLTNYLMTTPRNPSGKTYNTFPIITQSNTFIFGEENSSAGSYDVLLIDGEFELIHVAHDIFETSLKVKQV